MRNARRSEEDGAYGVVEVYHGLGLALPWRFERMDEDIDARGVVFVVYFPDGVLDGECVEEGCGAGRWCVDY